MNDQTQIILAPNLSVVAPSISPLALAERDSALAVSAVIGRVENAAQNEAAVRAHIGLKSIASQFEKARKAAKEPALEYGRAIDRVVATELLEVEKEIGRISAATGGFQVQEQRRVAEEQRLQQEELARIEREKIAEIQRLANEEAERQAAARREQAEADRVAREAQESAHRAASDATSKKQREAVRLAQEEAGKLALAAQDARERIAAESEAARVQYNSKYQAIQEAAQAATAAEAVPINTTRTAGQVTKTDWDLQVVNPYELAKFHPDCVRIEPLLGEIKRQLSMGVKIKGVRAEKKLVSSVRVGKMQTAIEV